MKFSPLISAVSCLAMAACASTGGAPSRQEAAAFAQAAPAPLQPYFHALYAGGERNAVLNFDRLGLAAMESGHYDIAEKSFDEAILRIESLYIDDPDAKKARSKFNAEAHKDFKGEPHERAMTFYYRGLLYMRDNDLDNARAAFLAANNQDKFAEDTEYAADFGLMDYLAGWSSRCLDQSSAMVERLGYSRQQHGGDALATLIDHVPQHLVIYESGHVPAKVGRGEHSEILAFSDRGGDDGILSVEPADDTSRFVLAGDLHYQATTRGGRPIDGINSGKAQFKETTGTVADVSSTISMVSMLNSNMQSATGNYDGALASANLGAVSALIGLVAQVTSSATKPSADTRYWESLPRNIYVGDAGMKSIGLVNQRLPLMEVATDRCRLSWYRGATSEEQSIPERLRNEPASDKRGDANLAFRQRLVAMFPATVAQ